MGLAALILTPLAVMLQVLEDAKRIPAYRIGGYLRSAVAAVPVHRLLVLWAEIGLGGRSGGWAGGGTRWFSWASTSHWRLGVAIGLYLQRLGVVLAVVPMAAPADLAGTQLD